MDKEKVTTIDIGSNPHCMHCIRLHAQHKNWNVMTL